MVRVSHTKKSISFGKIEYITFEISESELENRKYLDNLEMVYRHENMIALMRGEISDQDKCKICITCGACDDFTCKFCTDCQKCFDFKQEKEVIKDQEDQGDQEDQEDQEEQEECERQENEKIDKLNEFIVRISID